MKKHLYEIKRLDIPAYLKWWFIKYRNAGTLSEVLENLTSPITLQNSLRRKFNIFEVGGNSEQNTYTGKNKLNTLIEHEAGYQTTIAGITYTLNSDGSITAKGTATGNSNFTFSSNKQTIEAPLKMRGQLIGTIQGDARFTCYTSSWGNTTSLAMTNNDLVTKKINTINFSIFRVIVTDGATLDATLYLGITDQDATDDWEPYVGGQPAPNPEYNFPIRNVSGNVEVKVANGTDSTVEGYEEQTVIFPTQEGEVLHLGDTLEDDGVHLRRAIKVLDGTESFEQFSIWGNYHRFRCLILNAKTFTTNDNNGQLSSHFSYNKTGVFGENSQTLSGIFAQYHDSQYFYFVVSQTSLAEFKAWLAQQYANGTPVTIEYELAEEIIVPYTETQQTAHNQIKKLYSYKGTTHISSDNNPSPIFTIQYVKEE